MNLTPEQQIAIAVLRGAFQFREQLTQQTLTLDLITEHDRQLFINQTIQNVLIHIINILHKTNTLNDNRYNIKMYSID